MEWTWLKDWWRLKKMRRNIHNQHHEGSGEDNGSTYYDDDEDDDMCFCDDCMNVRVSLIDLLYILIVYCIILHNKCDDPIVYNVIIIKICLRRARFYHYQCKENTYKKQKPLAAWCLSLLFA